MMNFKTACMLLMATAVLSCKGTDPDDPVAPKAQSVSLELLGKSAVSAAISATVSDTAACYIFSCVRTSELPSSDDAIIESEKSWLASYKNSFNLLISSHGAVGDTTLTLKGLQPETDYTALAYCIDQKKNIVSPLAKLAFSTDAAVVAKVGTCIWHDVFVAEYYPAIAERNRDLSADVWMDTANPGVYTIRNPYSAANIADWFGLSTEDMALRTCNWRDADIVVDASDPSAVTMAFADLGVCINTMDGWISAGSAYKGLNSSLGKMTGGVVSFPEGGMVKACSEKSGVQKANIAGDFKIDFKFNE